MRLPEGGASCLGVGHPGSGALPPPTARPLGALPGPTTYWLWVRGGAGVGTRHQPHSARSFELALHTVGAARGCPRGAPLAWVVGRPGSGALPSPTARPSGGLPGCCACACPALPGQAGRPHGRVLVRLTCPLAFPASLFACSAPSGLGFPCLWLLLGFFVFFLLLFPFSPSLRPRCVLLCVFLWPRVPPALASCPPPHPFFFSFFPPPPPCAPLSPDLSVLRPGVPWAFASCCPPPFLFSFFFAPPPSLLSLVFLAFRLPLASVPPPPFFSCPAAFLPAAHLLCVFWGIVLCVPCPARPLCCARRLCCFWWLVLLVSGVAAFGWGSAGGSGCPALSFGGICRLWCPCLVWPSLGVLPVVSRSPVLCPVVLCCHVVLCCGALCFLFCFSPCWWRWFPVVPRWFWALGRFRVVSVSVLCLCRAVLVCLRRCSLFGALLPSRGWLVFSVVACCVCVFAVGPGCPLLSPGGSWWLLVSCLGGVLWCVPGCCAAPCCCALCRLALRCCALCCFVLLRLVLPRAVLCPGALSFVLEACAFWCRVLSCPPALCVFCCGVSLRGVVRRSALCRVRPGVSCCAFLVVSALCSVAVWPALPRCPASLCCAPWCCAAAWCRGVLFCRPVGFVSCVGVVVPTRKSAAEFRKIFFSSFFSF